MGKCMLYLVNRARKKETLNINNLTTYHDPRVGLFLSSENKKGAAFPLFAVIKCSRCMTIAPHRRRLVAMDTRPCCRRKGSDVCLLSCCYDNTPGTSEAYLGGGRGRGPGPRAFSPA